MGDKLAGKTALITGASKGIGAGIARAFAGEGCSIVMTARTGCDLDELAGDLAGTGADVATLPPNVEMLKAVVLPHEQPYVGRG